MTMLNGIYDKEAKPNTRGMIQSYNADKFDDILLRLSLFTFIHHTKISHSKLSHIHVVKHISNKCLIQSFYFDGLPLQNLIDIIAGFVWKNPLRFYPASLIQINPHAKSQKNPLEGGFF